MERFPTWTFFTAVVLLTLTPRPAAQNANQQNSPPDNPPSRVARISYLSGKVSFLRAGLNQWSQAALNFPATTGDRIYTDVESRAELEVGPYTVRLAGSTDLTITSLTDQMFQLGIQQGTIRMSVYELRPNQTIEVDTPNGALTVGDRGKYRIQTDANGDHTFVVVDSGTLTITDGSFSQQIDAGQAVRLTGENPVQVESIPMPLRDAFDAWSDNRDLQRTQAESANYVSSSTPGYSDLDEYGHWQQAEDYGPVWYPVVPAGWIPYRFGHWVWIDPWGWTWMEDEPWGFCPFHFGRWVLIAGVWGWLPGPIVPFPVYAPAFVGFLGGPGFSIGIGVDLVGWFPLGPRDPFSPWYHYGGDYLRLVNVTNVRNVTNIINIINVRDINEVHYAYQKIAATAVPKNVFSSGQPVAHNTVHLNPSQLAKAQIVPHPAVNPTRAAALPGKPVPVPPTRQQALRTANRAGAGAVKPGAANGRVERNAPPPESTRPLAAERMPGGTRAPALHPLVTRRAPPLPPVPFAERAPAMRAHPGRPLEPLQVEELRAGRPVGPMRDMEFPPHPIAIAPVRPVRPAPHARPPR